MNPFREDEPRVKVEARIQGMGIELILIAGLVVLLIGVANGL